MECGDSKSYQDVRAESYQLLEKRMGVNVKQRLTNKRRRMQMREFVNPKEIN